LLTSFCGRPGCSDEHNDGHREQVLLLSSDAFGHCQTGMCLRPAPSTLTRPRHTHSSQPQAVTVTVL
jgi:hypothetical protein